MGFRFHTITSRLWVSAQTANPACLRLIPEYEQSSTRFCEEVVQSHALHLTGWMRLTIMKLKAELEILMKSGRVARVEMVGADCDAAGADSIVDSVDERACGCKQVK